MSRPSPAPTVVLRPNVSIFNETPSTADALWVQDANDNILAWIDNTGTGGGNLASSSGSPVGPQAYNVLSYGAFGNTRKIAGQTCSIASNGAGAFTLTATNDSFLPSDVGKQVDAWNSAVPGQFLNRRTITAFIDTKHVTIDGNGTGASGGTIASNLIPGAGYTIGGTAGSSGTTFISAYEHNLNAAGGSTTAGFTINTQGWAANVAAFFTQANGGGGGTTMTLLGV